MGECIGEVLVSHCHIKKHHEFLLVPSNVTLRQIFWTAIGKANISNNLKRNYIDIKTHVCIGA
jgi:hypothetical protein